MHRQVQLHLYKFMCTYCWVKEREKEPREKRRYLQRRRKQKTFPPTAELFRNLLNIKMHFATITNNNNKFFSANKKGILVFYFVIVWCFNLIIKPSTSVSCARHHLFN